MGDDKTAEVEPSSLDEKNVRIRLVQDQGRLGLGMKQHKGYFSGFPPSKKSNYWKKNF